MVRCQAICKNGKRCSKKCDEKLCPVHNNEIECEECGECPEVKNRIRLKNCDHHFCKKCLADSFYNYQWCDGFSTEDLIRCPNCDKGLCDSDWSWVTNYLCEAQVLQRKIVYKISSFCASLYQILNINLDFEYRPGEVGLIERKWNRLTGTWYKLFPYTEEPDVVYFEKWAGRDHACYVFEYGDPDIRKLMPDLQKELVEYVFHPSRIKNIEQLDDM